MSSAPSGPLPAHVLAMLACPVCHGALSLHQEAPGGEASVRCAGCRRLYPIVDGIPVLIADRASL